MREGRWLLWPWALLTLLLATYLFIKWVSFMRAGLRQIREEFTAESLREELREESQKKAS